MEKRTIQTSARSLDTKELPEDVKIEGALSPKSLDSYIGQKKIKESLRIYIEAAKKRGESLDPMDVDRMGLDHTDRNLLLTMIEKSGGRPGGA